MTERSKWSDYASVIGVIVLVGSLIYTQGRAAQSNDGVAESVNRLRADMTTQFSAVQAQIASLPTQGVRLDNVERVQREIRAENAGQNVDINTVKQGLAVLASTVDSVRHDVQVLQDAANGRLPGGRR